MNVAGIEGLAWPDESAARGTPRRLATGGSDPSATSVDVGRRPRLRVASRQRADLHGGSRGVLTVDCTDDPGAIASLVPEWAALASRTDLRTPFALPQWTSTWWRHFAAEGAFARDRFRLYTVRDDMGRLVGVAPMTLNRRPGFGPGLRVLRFVGADPNVTEIRGPLLDPDVEGVPTALLRHLDAVDRRWDVLEWPAVRAGSELDVELRTRAGVEWTRDNPGFVLPLPDSWSTLQSTRGRNLKESLRKCRNSLRRAGLTHEFVVAEAPRDRAAAVERFFELHAHRARLMDTVAHRDVFATAAPRAFLRDLAWSMPQMRVFEVVVDGVVAASRVAFVVGPTLYLYYSGFRPEYGRFSVMTTTLAESLRWAIEQGLTEANLSTGRDVSKTRWDPTEIPMSDAVIVRDGLRATTGYRVLAKAREVNISRRDLVSRMRA